MLLVPNNSGRIENRKIVGCHLNINLAIQFFKQNLLLMFMEKIIKLRMEPVLEIIFHVSDLKNLKYLKK